MLQRLTEPLVNLVIHRWRWVLVFWLLVTGLLAWTAPDWRSVAYDGDFEYLPAEMKTVAASQVLDEAFPGTRPRSQIVLVLARSDRALEKPELVVGDDLLRRLHHRLAEVCWQRAIKLGYGGEPLKDSSDPVRPWLRRAVEELNQCIAVDERFYENFSDAVPNAAPGLRTPRMAIAYYDRANLVEQLAATEPQETTSGSTNQTSDDEPIWERPPADDLQDALMLVPDIGLQVTPIEQRDLTGWETLLDVLSWDDALIGSQLSKPSARLAVMQLDNELAATGNIATVEAVGKLLEDVQRYSAARLGLAKDPDFSLQMTGSAAIGGETLIAARDAIRYTESITVIMILVILVLVYRAPLLVAVPMLSITIAVVVSTSLVATLTDWSIREVVPWLDLRVFTTSRIFIVVILFGAGTDYCLFLIARLREEAAKAEWHLACRRALSGVTSALLGSALTTVFGLAMLWFASFGKYHYTGPIIAICLLIGLFVCLSFTPALLSALGPKVFWPSSVEEDRQTPRLLGRNSNEHTPASTVRRRHRQSSGIWGWIALKLTRMPMATLGCGVVLLLVPAVYGWFNESSVTYDLSSQLDTKADSRQGFETLAKHFKIGEINPVTVLLVQPEGEPRETLRKKIQQLSNALYEQPGIVAVRTANDPLGDFPPDREMGLLSGDAWRRRALRQHRVVQNYFFSKNPAYQDRLARLDVIIAGDPFSLETGKRVTDLQTYLESQIASSNSQWAGAELYLSGTTPSIIDLRRVTIADNQRIKIAVVIAVLLVLIVVIRRIGLCLYLIATVLLSYYATLGLTVLFFKAAYGDDYVGLDWKLPLFLFVILVAVGQDYNVYLVTRIVEEQRRKGWLAALRHAVSRTGGIITACGMVMAATFFSMTASAWLPALKGLIGIESEGTAGLRGITELGFALGLGVLIDTFYVRTILVPSFVTLMGRWSSRRRTRRSANIDS
jgi:RND superfamily putative drug exporter